jgi:hypothetical protein
VIRNEDGLEAVRDQVATLHQKYLGLAQQART